MFRPSVARSILYRKQKLGIQTLRTDLKNMQNELQIALEATAEVADGLQDIKRMLRFSEFTLIGAFAGGIVFGSYKIKELPVVDVSYLE